MELRDPMVNPVMLETVDPKESRDNVERRAIEVTMETKDTPVLMDPRYIRMLSYNFSSGLGFVACS